jgi:hypothetical protein
MPIEEPTPEEIEQYAPGNKEEPEAISVPFEKLPESTYIRGKPKRVGWYAYEEQGGADVDLVGLKKKVTATDDIDKYRTTCSVEYNKPYGSRGYTVIEVLQQLWGLPLNNLILAYVNALKPTSIRVTSGLQTTDASQGRVTVVYEERDGVEYVQHIIQEVEVLYGCGADVGAMLRAAKEGQELPEKASRGPFLNKEALAKVDFS